MPTVEQTTAQEIADATGACDFVCNVVLDELRKGAPHVLAEVD